jgi:dephospho-CoA kinase
MKKIIAICGYSGSGKSYLCKILKSKGYTVIPSSEVVLSKIEEEIKDIKFLSEEERLKKAEEYLKVNPSLPSRAMFEAIKNIKEEIIFIDGVKSHKDLSFVKDFKIIFVENPFEKRFELIKKFKNKYITKSTLLKRDEFDKKIGLDLLRKKADFVIENNNISEDEVENIINRIKRNN